MSAIISPAVYVREFFELRPVVDDGYTTLIMGFTSEGVSNDPTVLTSIRDFVALYGEPDPSRPEQIYSYQGVKDIIDGGGNALFVKLPYGAKEGYEVDDNYSALLFPTFEDTEETTINSYVANTVMIPSDFGALSAQHPFNEGFAEGDVISDSDWSLLTATLQANFDAQVIQTDCEGYLLGEPTRVCLSEDDYEKIKCGQLSWSDDIQSFDTGLSSYDPVEFGKAGMIILDNGRTNTYDGKSGYYITVSDNSDADPASPFDAVRTIQTSYSDSSTPNVWTEMDEDCYSFDLTGDIITTTPNVSETITGLANSQTNEPWENDQYKSWLNVTLWRLREDYSSDGNGQLVPNVIETHTGSVSENAITIGEGGVKKTANLEKIIQGKRRTRLCTFINPKISQDIYTDNGVPIKNIRMYRNVPEVTDGVNLGALPIGFEEYKGAYSVSKFATKDYSSACDVGNIPRKIDNALCTVDNPERVTIDLSVEAGLGTIWNTVNHDPSSWITGDPTDCSWCYNECAYLDIKEDMGRDAVTFNYEKTWREVNDLFTNFSNVTRLCNGGYKHLHIADPIRQILINGCDCKVYDNAKKCKDPYLFAECIYYPLKHQTRGINGEVATTVTIDAQWYLKNNIYTTGSVWTPSSPATAGMMSATPYPWDCTAGVNNGIIPDTLDIALDPVKRDRDLLWKINTNASYYDKSSGFMRYADKTLLKNDNIQLKHNSTRRALSFLQKEMIEAVKPFAFEFNTVQTRVRFKQEIERILNVLVNGGAIFDYSVSLSRNTPEQQQEGCLVADIAIKFSGKVEKIILNYNILRLDEPFQEIFN